MMADHVPMERVPVELTPLERETLRPLVEAAQREQQEIRAALVAEHGWEALDIESGESAFKALWDSLDKEARHQLFDRWSQAPHWLALMTAIEEVFEAHGSERSDWRRAWSLGPDGLRLEWHKAERR